MERIAQFEKVSLYQFGTDFMKAFPAVSDIKSVYENIKLPERATSGSAGYDFYAPVDFTLEQGKSLLIPTGIRAKINDGWSPYLPALRSASSPCSHDNTSHN
jgi:dUTP pyrophosphatase